MKTDILFLLVSWTLLSGCAASARNSTKWKRVEVLPEQIPSNVATPLALYVAKMGQVRAEKAAFVQINNFRNGLILAEPELMTVKGRHSEQPWKPIGPGQSDVGVFTREIASNFIAKIMADSATVAALSYRLAVIPEDKQSVPEYLVVYWSIESGLLSSPANRFSVKIEADRPLKEDVLSEKKTSTVVSNVGQYEQLTYPGYGGLVISSAMGNGGKAQLVVNVE